jgi:hypothetical protein
MVEAISKLPTLSAILVVAKRKDSPYRSGTRSGWIKVKTSEWKNANRYGAKLFAKIDER